LTEKDTLNKHTDWQTDCTKKYTSMQTNGHTHGRQADRQTGKQSDNKSDDRQAESIEQKRQIKNRYCKEFLNITTFNTWKKIDCQMNLKKKKRKKKSFFICNAIGGENKVSFQ